jgi:hypothetical protein
MAHLQEMGPVVPQNAAGSGIGAVPDTASKRLGDSRRNMLDSAGPSTGRRTFVEHALRYGHAWINWLPADKR